MYARKPILPLFLSVFAIFLFAIPTLIPTSIDAEPLYAPPDERGRVRVVNNNVVTDNGAPLRGEHLVFGTDANDTNTDSTILYDEQFWRKMRDQYHLNTVRLLMSRPPQNWSPDLGSNCAPPDYRCYDLDHVHGGDASTNGKTTLEIMDDLVDIAGGLGMYIILDYHPVFGYDQADAQAWWNRVAPRYADRTHVIYELANEPHPNTSYPNNLIDFQEALYQQIRADAPDTHVILWTFPVTDANISSTVARADGISYANASVGYHPYGEYESANLTDLRTQFPIIATEIGQNRIDMTNAAESINVSWVWLDGVAQKPGIDSSIDNYEPSDVTWPRDPYAVDQENPTPTPTPSATNTPVATPTSTSGQGGCGPLRQEAEDGILSGEWQRKSDSSASNQAYIVVPEANAQVSAADVNSHRARYCFTVSEAGVYRIYARVLAKDLRSNSFYVTVDGRPTDGYVWQLEVNPNYYVAPVNNQNMNEPIEVFLNEGDHLVKVFSRERGTRLDWIELRSTSASAPTATPTPDGCRALSWEAEWGELWGDMGVGTDLNASNGEYISIASSVGSAEIDSAQSVMATSLNRKNRVDYCITVQQAGEYVINARAFAPSNRGNSFFVQVDQAPAEGILWDIFPTNGTYVNSIVRERDVNSPAKFYLDAGAHTISFIHREEGARLDAFTVEPASVQSANTHVPTADEIQQNLDDEEAANQELPTKVFLPVTVGAR